MAESSASNSGLSAADYADLQHIGSQLPQGHPIKAKINAALAQSQPNSGLAGPSAPGPVEKVAPTEGPIARALTAGENRIATSATQGQQQEKQQMNDFLNNRLTVKGELAKNATPQNPINAVVNPEARERFGQGDIAGGIGEVGANILPLEIARVAGGGEPIASKATVANFTAPIRGAATVGNKILQNPTVQKIAPYAGTAAGYAAGEAVGHPWMGAGLGGSIGRAMSKGVTLPGERLGLPPEPPSYDTSVLPEQNAPLKADTSKLGAPAGVGKYQPPERVTPQQTQVRTVTPPVKEPSSPMKADVSRLGPPPGVGKYQPPERVPPPVRTEPIARPAPPVEPKPVQVSMADQIATAKGLGFRNLNDAINKFGFEGWQKILGQEQPKPVIAEPASVRPGSPSLFRANEPTQTPTLNRNQRADLMDDNAILQELRGEEGPLSMVTGRKGGGVSLFPNESQSMAGHARQIDLERGREAAAQNNMGQTKGSLIGQFRGVAAPTSTAEVQANRPLPGSDVAANRIVGKEIRPGEERQDYITGRKKK